VGVPAGLWVDVALAAVAVLALVTVVHRVRRALVEGAVASATADPRRAAR
jgi:hypothetical protein